MTTAARARPRSGGMRGWALLVAVGGMVGTLARALLETAVPAAPGTVPWTTLGINLVGSFVLGALLETLAASGPDAGRRKALRLGCGTGVLGGFTTYSTFALEVDRLVESGHAGLGIAYAAGSITLGIIAATAGIAVAATRRPPARPGRPGSAAGPA